MKRAARWIVLALPLLAAAGVWLDPTQVIVGKLAGDQFFASRPTRYWAHALRAGPREQAHARETLEQGGAAAVPVLVAMLTRSPSPDDAELRWTSAEILTRLGPDAAAAGPVLIAGLNDNDPHVQAVCAAALPKVGVAAEAAVGALVKLLPTPRGVVAARALAEYRGAAAPALPALTTLLQDSSRDAETRSNAARTIGRIGPDAASSLPALIQALDDPEWMLREVAAVAIGDLGRAAGSEGAAALIPLLTDEHALVRRAAAGSLGYLSEFADEAVPVIKSLLNDPDEDVRNAARDALRAIAPEELPADAAEPDSTSAATDSLDQSSQMTLLAARSICSRASSSPEKYSPTIE
jgi:HEAT repeat protein